MEDFSAIMGWGIVVGCAHFVVVGLLYGNPVVDRIYKRAATEEPGVRVWPSKARYLIYQFLGTQVEVFILVLAYSLVDLKLGLGEWQSFLTVGTLFTGIRTYPRFWNMWIQSTYPASLLRIELIIGSISTLTILAFFKLLS